MDRIQRNGGTAGIVAGVLLGLLFVLFFSLGQDIMAPEPAKSLAVMTQKWSMFQLASLVGLLTAAVAVPYAVGIATRLRDSAPTRAKAFLYITLLGLAGYGLESVMRWFGGRAIIQYAAADQAGALHAWVAISAVNNSLSMFGNAFTGAGTLIAGWAIMSTKALGAGVAWVGIVAGVVQILGLFSAAAPVFLGGFLLTVVWFLYAGYSLMQAK
jgi:hypothetical protein